MHIEVLQVEKADKLCTRMTLAEVKINRSSNHIQHGAAMAF